MRFLRRINWACEGGFEIEIGVDELACRDARGVVLRVRMAVRGSESVLKLVKTVPFGVIFCRFVDGL